MGYDSIIGAAVAADAVVADALVACCVVYLAPVARVDFRVVVVSVGVAVAVARASQWVMSLRVV